MAVVEPAERTAAAGVTSLARAIALVPGPAIAGALLVPFVGRDFFPTVDTGQFRLHVRAPAGTRIEQTERYFSEVESEIRRIIPKDEVDLVLDNIGLPNRTYAMAFGDSATTSMADGEILVALKHERSKSTPAYMAELRRELPERFPNLTFYFQSADIVSQILNYGVPSPIDIQVSGIGRAKNYEVAMQIAGHKTRAIFDRYNITNEEDIRQGQLKTERHLTDGDILVTLRQKG